MPKKLRNGHVHYETMTLPNNRLVNEALLVTTCCRIGYCFCEGLKEGDVIAILVGADYPVVLRSTAEPDQYILVGPATVYGMMDGELWPKNLDQSTDIILVRACVVSVRRRQRCWSSSCIWYGGDLGWQATSMDDGLRSGVALHQSSLAQSFCARTAATHLAMPKLNPLG